MSTKMVCTVLMFAPLMFSMAVATNVKNFPHEINHNWQF